jgi:anti-sigma-K factor RskA
MTEEFETEALHYLLGEMDAPQRAAFEDQLARDSGARAALKSCADALGRFACDTAPAEPMTAMDQRAALSAILGAVNARASAPAAVSAGKVIAWSSYFWPIAAAVLLGLNLWQFERPLRPLDRAVEAPKPDSPRAEEIVATEKTAVPAASVEPAAPAVAGMSAVAPEPPRSDAETAPRIEVARAVAAESSRQLEKLRNDYAELQRNNNALRAEYDAAMRHLTERVMLDKGPGRLAAMELVDADSFVRGERKGLVEIARGILTEPGVVVADLTTAVNEPAEHTPTLGFGAATAGKGETLAQAKAAYAWAVFDDKEHQGYLNLYDLPLVAADQSLQLWVKPVDSADFQRVGEVPPEFYGSSGSLRYKLPETTAVPAEILITQEPRNTTADQPTGPAVLRGP